MKFFLQSQKALMSHRRIDYDRVLEQLYQRREDVSDTIRRLSQEIYDLETYLDTLVRRMRRHARETVSDYQYHDMQREYVGLQSRILQLREAIDEQRSRFSYLGDLISNLQEQASL